MLLLLKSAILGIAFEARTFDLHISLLEEIETLFCVRQTLVDKLMKEFVLHHIKN